MAKKFQEIWDYMSGAPTLGDVTEIEKGDERNRPPGECVVCEKFAKEALIHESPRTAKCCQGCDAEKKCTK